MTSDTDFFRYEEPKKLFKNNAMLLTLTAPHFTGQYVIRMYQKP
jgi:hypothetical protein